MGDRASHGVTREPSHRFLVAWRTVAYGVSGRLIDSNGSSLSGVVQLAPPAAGTGSRDPAIAWNPATDEFGLITVRLDLDQCAGVVPADSCRGRLRVGDVPILVFRVERSRRRIDVNTILEQLRCRLGSASRHHDGHPRPLGECGNEQPGDQPTGFRSVAGDVVQPRGRDAVWQ